MPDDPRWDRTDRYISRQFCPPDAALRAAESDSAAAGLPTIQLSPPQGKLLQVLAETRGTRRALEIGTLGGYSAIWLARGLPADGRLISLEVNPRHAEVAKTNLARAGLADRVDVRVGDARETLPKLETEGAGPFDLIFIDADKPSYPLYLSWALRLSRKGTVILADNVVRQGAISDPDSTDPNVVGVRRFLELLATEPRVNATVIQTVGAKGYDGFSLAFVTSDK
jgi:predicted O-methyltransferase YrrM